MIPENCPSPLKSIDVIPNFYVLVLIKIVKTHLHINDKTCKNIIFKTKVTQNMMLYTSEEMRKFDR